MTTRAVRTEQDREDIIRLIQSRELPCTVQIIKGASRSIEQNKLQRKWLLEAAEQLSEDSPEGYRAYCKLHYGVPILRNENEAFRVQYDEIVKPLPYEQKLEVMKEPIDLPVTRLMTVKQKSRYLDEVYQFFRAKGVKLTEPEEREAYRA